MTTAARIMIVEDDDIIANIISQMLEKKGYSVVGKIASGEDAIMKSAALKPDLVVMDITLRGLMDGVSAAGLIFQLFHYPIIFLTAMCDDAQLDHAKSAEPLGFIYKPFTEKELTANVELALYNHSMRKNHLLVCPAGDPKNIMDALDPIIIMDKTGRIIFFNPYAGWFLDLPEDQIMMKYWRDVIMLINDQTDEQLKDPVPEVIGQKTVVSHDFNTAMVSKSSRRWSVKATFRPLLDNSDRFFGILLSIKEKTRDQIKMAQNFRASR
jgi:CheY-like chemotaxis protein